KAKRAPELGELDVVPQIPVAIGASAADVPALRDAIRPLLALYVGGMGARGKNFYNDLACRYGFEAAAALPDALIDGVGLLGPEGLIRERLAALAESGVTTLNMTPLGADPAATVDQIERIVKLADGL
ncbi:MAG TPA: LLM class F420-dependent oxidoreductase, partial [Pseudonocardia sp.]|nr:LLM class F420-dependent oxidoreductase [Pseudonocardia sp.]